MSRNVMAGLSAFLVIAGTVGLTEVNTASAIVASAFAIMVGIVGAKHAITQ